jgi:hypothetical protein
MTYANFNDLSHHPSLVQDVLTYHARFGMHQYSKKSLYTQHVERVLYMCSTIPISRKAFF